VAARYRRRGGKLVGKFFSYERELPLEQYLSSLIFQKPFDLLPSGSRECTPTITVHLARLRETSNRESSVSVKVTWITRIARASSRESPWN
jgi:hypothetical protein